MNAPMDILLELRNEQHQVDLILPNGATRPVLGTRTPAETDLRKKAVLRWGGASGPRTDNLASIEQPLPQRTQTILAHQVSDAVRAQIDGAAAPGLTPARKP